MSFERWQPARAPGFWAVSLALHAALLAGLWVATPELPIAARAPRDDAAIQASLAQAQRLQMQRRVRALEQLQQQLGGTPAAAGSEALPNEPEALLARAQKAAAAVQKAAERTQAEELARLLKITPEAAQKRLALQAAKAPAPASAPRAAPSVAEQLAQLERRAQQAASDVALRDARAAGGNAVSLGGTRNDSQGSSSTESGQGGIAGASVGGGGEGPGGRFVDARQYTPRADFDAAARAATRLARGRSFGAGGTLTDRVYLSAWYLAGPFEGHAQDSLAYVHPPEQGLDLDAAYAGANGRTLRWRYVDQPRYPWVPQPAAENAVYYAYTEVRVDSAQDVWLDIGADDDAKLWLNDEVVWTSDSGDKLWYRQAFTGLRSEMARYGLVEGTRRVRLKAGRNTLLIKLYNGSSLMFFSVVLRP
jgi:hypothetical protein